MLVTAESCTGGLLAAALTSVAGSSDVLERGLVTYSNLAKQQLLGVDPDLIQRDGAVSETVAAAMADGALNATQKADLALSVTGVAGPAGGTASKPVGLVFIGGKVRPAAAVVQRHEFQGDRQAVRLASVEAALRLGLELVSVRPSS